jgi:F420-dependent methylenetetrahydromethanopterin dehydrogenase
VFPWNEVVGREEIERMVREIMENKEGNLIRVRVKQNQLSQVAKYCKMYMQCQKVEKAPLTTHQSKLSIDGNVCSMNTL